MDVTNIISRIFSSVLNQSINDYKISTKDIRIGIQNIKEVNKPNPDCLSLQILDVANYNDIAHRCAYLHRYASLYTSMVEHMFAKAMEQENVHNVFKKILSTSESLQICCLGAGPGSDLFGVIFVLISKFGFFKLSATLIDIMIEWQKTFDLQIKKLRQGHYGLFGDFVQPHYFQWNYIDHNLLGEMSEDVNIAIHKAHLVTMVKFVSAAACKDTFQMIMKIFRSLKPGALVLYIDNAGGPFHQVMQQCASDCKMTTVFGPLEHELYSNVSFNIRKFGYLPCMETRVSVHLWKKLKCNYQSLTVDSDYIGVKSQNLSKVPQTYTNATQPSLKSLQSSSKTVNVTLNQCKVINSLLEDSENLSYVLNLSNVSQNYVYNPKIIQTNSHSIPTHSQLQLSPLQLQHQKLCCRTSHQNDSIVANESQTKKTSQQYDESIAPVLWSFRSSRQHDGIVSNKSQTGKTSHDYDESKSLSRMQSSRTSQQHNSVVSNESQTVKISQLCDESITPFQSSFRASQQYDTISPFPLHPQNQTHIKADQNNFIDSHNLYNESDCCTCCVIS